MIKKRTTGLLICAMTSLGLTAIAGENGKKKEPVTEMGKLAAQPWVILCWMRSAKEGPMDSLISDAPPRTAISVSIKKPGATNFVTPKNPQPRSCSS